MQVDRQVWKVALFSIALSTLAACGGRSDGEAGSAASNGLTTFATVALESPGRFGDALLIADLP